VNVRLPSLLDSYTGGLRELELEGTTVGEALLALDVRYPGVRFRLVDEQDAIRPHVNVFVDRDIAPDLNTPVSANQTMQIVGALSGG
jgi:molybdopterin synthase sulfur carrier subunit